MRCRTAGRQVGVPPQCRGHARQRVGLRGGEVGQRSLDQPGVESARAHVGVGEQPPQERDVGADAEHSRAASAASSRASAAARSGPQAITLASIGS